MMTKFLKMRFLHSFLWLLLPFSGTAMAAVERLTDSPMPRAEDWRYALAERGQLWLAYYDVDRALWLRAPDGSRKPVMPAHAAEGPSGLALAVANTGPEVLWRAKHPTKGLYLARTHSPDSPVIELGGNSQPSARIEARRDRENLDLLWVGEGKVEGSDADYYLFYRQVRLADGALSPIEPLLSGFYPVWAANDSGSLVVLSWAMDESPRRIVARTRAAGSAAFSDPVTVAEVPGITPIFKAFRSGSRWFGLWLAQHSNDPGGFLLEGAYSDDQGASWQRFAFNELRGFDVASAEVAADDQGHILIALATRQRDTGADTKHEVLVIRSTDRGTSWGPPVALRPAGLRDRFRATNPDIAFGPEPGQVLVVWEDWREIRSRLYASLSSDFGETWALRDVRLPHESPTNLSLRDEASATYVDGNRFMVIAEEVVDDGLREKHLVRLSFTAEDLLALSRSGQSPEALADRERDGAKKETEEAEQGAERASSETDLRARINLFWQAMLSEDYEKSYTFYDPFFRARNSLEIFKKTMGRVHYAEYEIKSVHIEGNKAEIRTRVKASLGPYEVPTTGETITRPEREVEVDETWLWVDDAWYREFYSPSADYKYTVY